MDTVHKQEFRVRDLPTRSVTLFPTRAQVVRDISDVVLRPGSNEIAIVGLSPTVDANSIKVEGTGSTAVVSDIAVELLPNQDIFEEVYPDEAEAEDDDASADETSSASDDDDDDDDDGDDGNDGGDDDGGPDASPELKKACAALREVRARLAALTAQEAAGREAVRSAVSRLDLLDAHGKAVLDPRWGSSGGDADATDGHGHGHGRPPRIDAVLATYRAERARAFEDHQAGVAAQKQLAADMAVLRRRQARLERARRRAAAPARRARRQARSARARQAEAAQRRRAVAAAEKLRVRQAREACWPRVCYTVRITLEVPVDEEADGTVEEDARTVDKPEDDAPPCRITLTYLTTAASWSPTYDLQLSTTSATGVLAFDALLHNHTSETWARCAVVLSTSQTTMAGLDDTAVPALVPWRLKLARAGEDAGAAAAATGGGADDSLLRSREERAWRARTAAAAAGGDDADAGGGTPQRPREELFGLGPIAPEPRVVGAMAPRGGGMVCRKMVRRPTKAGSAALEAVPPPPMAVAPAPALAPPDDLLLDDDLDAATLDDGPGALGFQESAFEETGLTATYELPGLKTLAPTPPPPEGPPAHTSTAGFRKRLVKPPTTTPYRGALPPGSKQRVARVAFTGVQFRHTVVAKYKPAAFLRATLRNPSRLTLLRGPVGLTLDGAFLGRATLPRCGPDGDAVTLGLGVAPGLRVAYAAPEVRRTTAGRFAKEARTAYTRSVVVTMGGSTTAPSSSPPATLLVFDQVPVSEDEKLRVEVQQPRGLVVDGPPVTTGVGSLAGRNSVLPAADTDVLVDNDAAAGAAVTDWGAAGATLKANGEVVWEVTLQPGRAVRLDLAYEVSLPAGEGAVQC